MKLWDGRFQQEPNQETLIYTQTTDIDQQMLASDLHGSIAHVLMLCRQGILSEEDGRAILCSLLRLLECAGRGELQLRMELEDVHLNIESLVIEELGPLGGRMHTARSRNDQVVTDARLYVREALLQLVSEVLALVEVLADKARMETDHLLLGYTHSQAAQPISYGFWLSCYASIFLRDAGRLLRSVEAVNQNPLGACALAGTSFPIDRNLTTRLLGFDGLALHALDATSSRDFLLEPLAAMAIFMSNVSRISEEIVIWSSFENRVLQVEDSFATGSSIMPQKKNPVVAELGRARAGGVYGALMHLLTVVKSVPMGYCCDLQEDKPPVWRALDISTSSASILRSQMASVRFQGDRAAQACLESFSTITELANYLTREKGMPFRDAHRITGRLVLEMEKEGRTLVDSDSALDTLRQLGIDIDAATLRELVDPAQVMRRQRSAGGTAPERVMEILGEIVAEHGRLSGLCRSRAAVIQDSLARMLDIASRFAEGEMLGELLDSLET